MENLNCNARSAPKTIFCDIDGTLVRFPDTIEGFKNLPKGEQSLEVLPGALDKLWEWETQGFKIILTTGRKESMRKVTEELLTNAGIFWDQLVMGLGPGKRYLINDINNGASTAFAVNVKRNEGIGNIDLPETTHINESDPMVVEAMMTNNNQDLLEDVLCPPRECNPYTDKIAERKAYEISVQRHQEAIQDYIENGEDISKEPGMEYL